MTTAALPPHLYHRHHGAFTEDLPFWRALAARHARQGRVLALGCGTGRVALPLAEDGAAVVGVDYDPRMLAFLRSRMPAKSPLRLLQADFTALPLASATFALAVLPCNTYTTLPFRQRAVFLESVARVLRQGGIFAFSAPNPRLVAALPAEEAPEEETAFVDPHDGLPVQVATGWQRSGARWKVVWHYDRLFPDGRVQRLTVIQTHYLRALEEEEAALQQAGLALQAVWGNFDGSPLIQEAPYWVLIARRL